MKHVAFPFLTLRDAQVESSAWCLLDPDGNTSGLSDYVVGWDYARDLRLNRKVGLVAGQIGSTLGFSDENVELEGIIRVGTGPGSMPRRTWILGRFNLRPGRQVLVDHTISGNMLSHRLWIETTIALASHSDGASRFAPYREGSILWRDEIDVSLEGDSPRFPMEIVSFSERFSGTAESAALWHLHWRPGHLHRDFGGSVRLFLNHDRQDFIDRFVGSDRLTLQCTLADVITQVLEHVLHDENLEEILKECESTSVAGHIETWLDLAFPGRDLTSIRTLLRSSPGHFHSAILAMANPQILEGIG